MKAEHISIALTLSQIPHIDDSLSALLEQIGVASPPDLVAADADWLYDKLCQITRSTQPRNVLFKLRAAVHFANGHSPQHWKHFAD